ncbi:hypothetical protein [Halopiger goleimassiliensis]|uniref:hypothetical protein n=1 Tax=Halopiger goleimassiliensis TaxID=1293048 RepID=UPI0006781EBF|nr:hypothetical protein [Halopiger goleimassiliensis]
MADSIDAWLSSRKATNQLLVAAIVVIAAGFVSVGAGPDNLRVVSELLLTLVLFGAAVLGLVWLLDE